MMCSLKWVVTDEFSTIWDQTKSLPNRGVPWVGFSLVYKGAHATVVLMMLRRVPHLPPTPPWVGLAVETRPARPLRGVRAPAALDRVLRPLQQTPRLHHLRQPSQLMTARLGKAA